MASNDVKPNGAKAAVAPVVSKPAAPTPQPVKAATPKVEAAKPAPAPAASKTAQPSASKPAVKSKPVAKKLATKSVLRPAAAVAAAVKPVIKKEIPMNDTIKATADKTQAQAKAMFADVGDRAKGAMEKGTKMFEEMNSFGKGNVEALVESSKIATKGAEAIMKYSADYARTAVEKANATASKFASLKSPTEMMKLQSDIAKETMDSMMSETAKFTESYLKLLGEITQPISNRVALAAEKIKIAA